VLEFVSQSKSFPLSSADLQEYQQQISKFASSLHSDSIDTIGESASVESDVPTASGQFPVFRAYQYGGGYGTTGYYPQTTYQMMYPGYGFGGGMGMGYPGYGYGGMPLYGSTFSPIYYNPYMYNPYMYNRYYPLYGYGN